MKQLVFAATLLATAGLVFAQAPAAPAAQAVAVEKPKCEPKPEYGRARHAVGPAPKLIRADRRQACMMAYVEQQKVQQQAHLQAANGAITDYNETMKSIRRHRKTERTVDPRGKKGRPRPPFFFPHAVHLTTDLSWPKRILRSASVRMPPAPGLTSCTLA